jgi:hypothetical protein
MGALFMSLVQHSATRFELGLHEPAADSTVAHGFDPTGLRAVLQQQPDGSSRVELPSLPESVAAAREAVFERLARDETLSLAGGLLALLSPTDSWHLTVLPEATPAWHVALAFSFFPLAATVGPGRLVHLSYQDSPAASPGAHPAWDVLHPAVAAAAARIVAPASGRLAEGCARLAARPGIVSYLLGMGDTFSLADIEHLAQNGQTSPSIVLASAQGLQGEDRSWMYRVRLSPRAVQQAGLLQLGYARAKSRLLAELARYPARESATAQQAEIRQWHIEHFAHHLALLQVCLDFGIGLWSCPMSATPNDVLDEDDDAPPASSWAEAVAPEREAGKAPPT